MRAHAIMLHHFHDAHHPAGQGSITADTFAAILEDLNARFTLLSAEEWLKKFLQNQLNQDHICLTFDDNLRCQYDIALPILRKKNLRAFWFIYTTPLEGKLERIELYRYFRMTAFRDVETFYAHFNDTLQHSSWQDTVSAGLRGVDTDAYLADYPFYTSLDRWFRYVRDRLLNDEQYDAVMDLMMAQYGFDQNTLLKRLWMDRECLQTLVDEGHLLGLHSHTHPTQIGKMTAQQQQNEYAKNRAILEEITKKPIQSMAHPCGSWSQETLEMLAKMGIVIGFHSAMRVAYPHPLTIPREDHTTLVRRLSTLSTAIET